MRLLAIAPSPPREGGSFSGALEAAKPPDFLPRRSFGLIREWAPRPEALRPDSGAAAVDHSRAPGSGRSGCRWPPLQQCHLRVRHSLSNNCPDIRLSSEPAAPQRGAKGNIQLSPIDKFPDVNVATRSFQAAEYVCRQRVLGSMPARHRAQIEVRRLPFTLDSNFFTP